MPATSPVHRAWKFGAFTLDLDRGALVRADTDVRLRPRPYAVLSYLVERHGRLVTKEELLDAIWGHRAVTEGAVTHSVIEIRRALGDEGLRMIRTVPRRGFVFEEPVIGPDEAGPAPAEVLASEPTATPPATAESGSMPPRTAWRTGLVLGLMLAASGSWWSAKDRVAGDAGLAGETAVATPSPSIAVLPFVDLSPELDQGYFSDGLAEELLNLLARVPGLHVTARTSSFSFKGQNADIATIAETLNVDHVLEGSVRKWGDRVRITAQLVEVAGSSHLWSETYDRELGDLFAIQDEIAGSVVQALQVTLAGGEPPQPGGTTNPAASEHYLHARFLFNRRSSDDLTRARLYYRQAVDGDPDFGRAWVGLAGALQLDIFAGGLPAEEGLPEWRAAVERALALVPEIPEAQQRAAAYYGMTGQTARAHEHMRKALAAGPDDPQRLILAAGSAYENGHFEEAITLQRRALALDPVAATYHTSLASYLLSAGHYQEAEAELRRSQELSPGQAVHLEAEIAFVLIRQGRYGEALASLEALPEGEDRDLGLVLAYRALERREESDAVLERLMARPDDQAAVRVAEAFAQSGAFDESFRWLETARSRLDPATHPLIRRVRLVETRASTWLIPLRADPRWETWGRE